MFWFWIAIVVLVIVGLSVLAGRMLSRPRGEPMSRRQQMTALKELATVGEVCNALREVWGVYTPQEFF